MTDTRLDEGTDGDPVSVLVVSEKAMGANVDEAKLGIHAATLPGSAGAKDAAAAA